MLLKCFFRYLCCAFVWTRWNTGASRIFRRPVCDSPIYCHGDLLKTVQMSNIFADSKTFVDMNMRKAPDKILEVFADLMRDTGASPNKTLVKKFVNDNFISGTELKKWIPNDFKPDPAFVSKITNPNVARFASKIVSVWKDLGRQVKKEVFQNPDLHSTIPIPNGFIIPGGRFNEYYYWDNYWIIEGLILCEMTSTVRGILDNFISVVKRYGFIPNGGRIYYIRRSQPPMLTFMARNYFEASKNITWLEANVKYLEKEVKFWLRERMRKVKIGDRYYSIGFYTSDSDGPRPESYREDVATAKIFTGDVEQQELFNELKAAAQSGWDFSSRWIFDKNGDTYANLSHTQTTRVAPVDLNSYLYGAFNNMANFYTALGRVENERFWKSKAKNLLAAFRNVFWNDRDGVWYDFDVRLQRQRQFFAASNLVPLWVNAYHDKTMQISKIVRYVAKEGIAKYPGGIPATKRYTGEQWDFPNCFPPLQSLVVQGFERSGHAQAQYLARKFATKWVEANMIGAEKHGVMYEKYHAEFPGEYGIGGEYKVQQGFGWTNGVVLDFINRYYTVRNRK